MPFSKCILVVAYSGRMLVQALSDVGLRAVVIDCFNDLDTQYHAEACYTVPSLAVSHLMPIAEQAIRQYAVEAVIYGSGLEYYPESLDALGKRLAIWGNHPALFSRLLDKNAFFISLDQLGIDYPAVSYQPPTTEGWLIKPMQGQGGIGVKAYRPALPQLDEVMVYWQRFQAGTIHSLSFWAKSDNIQVVGFNTQWCRNTDDGSAFQFAGIRTGAELPPAQQAVVVAWAKKLALAFDLIGLNTLDFIYTGQQCLLLEINPRPSASMQLYSPEWLLRHIGACLGEKQLRNIPEKQGSYGYHVVFAPAEITIPDHFDWPIWCLDIPKVGTKIATTQPICSIIADEQCSTQLMVLLQMREQLLLSKLTKSI